MGKNDLDAVFFIDLGVKCTAFTLYQWIQKDWHGDSLIGNVYLRVKESKLTLLSSC